LEGAFVNGKNTGESLLTCAALIAETVGDLESRSELMATVAGQYAGTGLLDDAVEVAERIGDPYIRDQTLANIASECIQFEDAAYADDLLDTIEDESLYAVAMEQMAVKFAATGDFDKAVEIASELSDSGPAFSEIALIYSNSGQVAKAVELAQSVEDPDLRAAVFIQLAFTTFQNKREEDAEGLLVEATGFAGEIEFAEQRISTLLRIASLYQEMGREESAFDILSGAYQLCDEYEGAIYDGLARSYAKDQVLAQIAGSFARLKRHDQADSVMDDIENPFQFALALTRVALEYHNAGESPQALTLLTQAREIGTEEKVNNENSLKVRDSVLAELAVCFATIGHFEEALQITEMINAPDRLHLASGEIAKICVRAGNNSCAFKTAELVKGAHATALHYLLISDALVESGQQESADQTLSQALTTAGTIDEPYSRTLALLETAVRFARREQQPKALDVLFEALTSAAAVRENYRQALALIGLAGKYREVGFEPGEREQKVLEEIALKL
jgi:tetratricopeptide (TPR) repeat protein